MIKRPLNLSLLISGLEGIKYKRSLPTKQKFIQRINTYSKKMKDILDQAKSKTHQESFLNILASNRDPKKEKLNALLRLLKILKHLTLKAGSRNTKVK